MAGQHAEAIDDVPNPNGRARRDVESLARSDSAVEERLTKQAIGTHRVADVADIAPDVHIPSSDDRGTGVARRDDPRCERRDGEDATLPGTRVVEGTHDRGTSAVRSSGQGDPLLGELCETVGPGRDGGGMLIKQAGLRCGSAVDLGRAYEEER